MIGIDVGRHAVRFVELDGEQVRRHIKVSFPQEDDGADRSQEIIADTVREQGWGGEEAWGSVGGVSVISHQHTFPRMSTEELADAVQLEADQFISRPWEDMDFAFTVLGEDGNGRENVLFAVAPKDLTENVRSDIRSSALYCHGITLNAYAVAAAYTRGRSGASIAEDALLVHIGDSDETSIVLLEGEEPSLCREVSFGIENIFSAYIRELDVSREEARRTCLKNLLPEEQRRPIIAKAVLPLVGQINRTIEYRAQRSGGEYETSIVLSGEAAFVEDFADVMGEQLGENAEFADPFAGVELDQEWTADIRERSRYAVALGNALLQKTAQEKGEPDGACINLIEDRSERKPTCLEKLEPIMLGLMIAVYVVSGFLGGAVFYSWQRRIDLRERMLKHEKTVADKLSEGIIGYSRRDVKRMETLRSLVELYESQPHWAPRLRVLQTCIPPGLILERVKGAMGDGMKLKGRAQDRDGRAVRRIEKFINCLRENDEFMAETDKIVWQTLDRSVNGDTEESLQFDITCQ
ncbi:MAG: pilus assembly protein PilM [Planctomycetota bacterium]